jgi:hypothetical protein
MIKVMFLKKIIDKFLLIFKKYGVLKIVIRSQFKKKLPNKEWVKGDTFSSGLRGGNLSF